MSASIIDRRKNGKNKSSTIRHRFLARNKAAIKKSVHDIIGSKGMKDNQGGEVVIPDKGIKEPFFHHNSDGDRKYVIPGNTDKIVGDIIPKPSNGGGKGKDASDGGEGEDEFTFQITHEEFLDFFFDDLELPDMVKTSLKDTEVKEYKRSGFVTTGMPSNLNIIRSMRNAIGRRAALQYPYEEELAEAEEEIKKKKDNDEKISFAELRNIVRLRKEIDNVPFIDDVDIRYNAFETRPIPSTRAVMFCLMDVSGSMSEHEKTLAKKFFLLLHLFLQRHYAKIELVFIRHTHEAHECSEEEFFYRKDTGGTIVSTCLTTMNDIIKDRYNTADWNIYAAQASDGDNWSGDSSKCMTLLDEFIMPACQYFAYIEILDEHDKARFSDSAGAELWLTYRKLAEKWSNFKTKRVSSSNDIFPVFKELFIKKGENVK